MKKCQDCGGLAPDHVSICPHCSNGCAAQANRRPMLRLAQAGTIGLLSVTLQACYGVSIPLPHCAIQDLDNDGFFQCAYLGPEQERPWFNEYYPSVSDVSPYQLGSTDCDDANPAINPNASDLTLDGIDQDCDRIDGPTTGDPQWIVKTHSCDLSTIYDRDADGYFRCMGNIPHWAEPHIIANGLPFDCHDFNPAINPGATEILDDNIDQDCDGIRN